MAAIKETLDHWNEGRSRAHLMGVSQIAPSHEHKLVQLSSEESSSASLGFRSPRKTSSGPYVAKGMPRRPNALSKRPPSTNSSHWQPAL